MSESESNSENRMKAVLNDDLLAVLAPVLDWYQSDEHPEREPLDILRDIVADLQTDRADALAGASDKRRLDWLEQTQTAIGYNVECCAWGVDFEAPYGATIREAIDAGILSAND